MGYAGSRLGSQLTELMFVSGAGHRQPGLKMLFCSSEQVKVGRGLFGTICFADLANKPWMSITDIRDSLLTSLRDAWTKGVDFLGDVSDLTRGHPLKL